MLAPIDRADFPRAVRQHATDRSAKRFRCWDHFVAMLFCQVVSAHSLREICDGLATALRKLIHLELSCWELAPPPAYFGSLAPTRIRPWKLSHGVPEPYWCLSRFFPANQFPCFRTPLKSLRLMFLSNLHGWHSNCYHFDT